MAPETTISVTLVKRALKYTYKYKCTIEMLYLMDKQMPLTHVQDLERYNGKITSCMNLLDEEDGPMYRQAKKLIQKKLIPIDLVHKCAMIKMGTIGTIDYKYINKYPETSEMVAQIGNIVEDYYHDIIDTKRLYEFMKNIDDIPDYTTDLSSIICSLSGNLDIVRLFENTDTNIGTEISLDIIMEITPNKIRRKISVRYPPKYITKRYIKPSQTTSHILCRLDKKDVTIYPNRFIFTRNRHDDDETTQKRITNILNILQKTYPDINIRQQQEINTRMYFNHGCYWHRRVMAYVVEQHFELAILDKEVNDKDSDKEMLSVYVIPTHTRCTIRNKSVVVSGTGDELITICNIAIMTNLLKVYKNMFGKIYKILFGVSAKGLGEISDKTPYRSKIDNLRKKLPELFARNYTRECHRLPVLLETKQEAKRYEKMGRLVIKYPQTGKYSRWYSSPSNDLYVGLKVNRLANKHMFKYIVVCYTSNHLLNPSKRTYQYYVNNDEQHESKYKDDIKTLKVLTQGRHGPIPRIMEAEYGVQGYKRLGTGGSLESCLEKALGTGKDILTYLDKNPHRINILKQEHWNKSEEQIRNGLLSSNIDVVAYYRLYEETYKCNIIIIQVDTKGKYKLSIPDHAGGYIWSPCKYKKYVLVLKNIRTLYQDTSVSYELIVKEDTHVFDIEDELVSKLVKTKQACTLLPTIDIGLKPKSQYIDEDGKCVILFFKDGSSKECFSRPYPCKITSRDVVLSKCSVLYKHMLQMDKLYNKSSTWLSTTTNYLYFPDDESFIEWMDL